MQIGIPLESCKNRKAFCGVYILMLNGEVVWVGASQNILSRIASHRDKKFDAVRVIWTSAKNRYITEAKTIMLLRPKINRKQNKLLAMSGSIDWKNNNNRTISETVGCTREFVRQIRGKLHKPTCCFRKLRPRIKFCEFKSLVAHKKSICGNDFISFGRKNIKNWCKELGLGLKWAPKPCPTKYPWHKTDWSLSGAVIARMYGCSQQLVSLRRKQFNRSLRPLLIKL